MLLRIFPALAAMLLLAVPVAAGSGDISRPIGVVELFTSQGCNSCPPADELLGELANRGDVVALSYHVDYWDYLGWRDTLGNAENSARQRDYAESLGIRSVYTPQVIVNGRHNLNGADGEAITRALRSGTLPVEVKVRRIGESVTIEAGAAAGPVREAHITIVYFDPPKQVRIGSGENDGRTITYWNAVTGFQAAGIWHGEQVRFEIPLSEIMKKGAGGCAVLLQKNDENGIPGPIIGAAMIGKPVR